jgi:mono/diheme cytochrome c family protein
MNSLINSLANNLIKRLIVNFVTRLADCRLRPALLAVTLLLGLSTTAIRADEPSGPALYQTFCAACHGVGGEGDPTWPKPNALGDIPPPPHNAKGHTWRHSDDDLVMMTLNGHRDPYNGSEFLTMPAFKGILTEAQVVGILDHLKTLWTDQQLAAQAALNNSEHIPGGEL